MLVNGELLIKPEPPIYPTPDDPEPIETNPEIPNVNLDQDLITNTLLPGSISSSRCLSDLNTSEGVDLLSTSNSLNMGC